MNEVLRLEGVSKTYAKDGPAPVEVLRGLNLTVARGGATRGARATARAPSAARRRGASTGLVTAE